MCGGVIQNKHITKANRGINDPSQLANSEVLSTIPKLLHCHTSTERLQGSERQALTYPITTP